MDAARARNDMGAIIKIASSYFRCCRTAMDRDDLVGEVALGWAEGLSRLDGSRSDMEQTGFLFTYAKGFARNWIRNRVRHFGNESVLNDEDRDVGDSEDMDAEDIFEKLTVAAVLDAVMGLPERERDVMIALYYHGLTMQEIGDAMGLSRERIRQIKERGLSRIRPLFQEAA